MNDSAPKLEIAMLTYPGLTLLDLIGPQTVFSWFANIHLVWKTKDLVFSDTNIGIQPTDSFATCPRDLDVLFVPGGFGQPNIMGDREVLEFLADRALRAKYVTSVCSGSLLLGAAGLLKGYKATSHWAARAGLSAYGAEPVDARVVVDRNRVSGGGVTAGIDFGLVLLAKLRGDDAAKLTQLAMEYDPAPPFNAGNPKSAGPEIVLQAMSAMSAAMEHQSGRTL
ncbi:MAG TPA: DJ-1/PfpI family protein [Candidatus Binataceae bacterium]|nr:DJ-1/PfpI family protein [Candidatus Binataceae bacterium]